MGCDAEKKKVFGNIQIRTAFQKFDAVTVLIKRAECLITTVSLCKKLKKCSKSKPSF